MISCSCSGAIVVCRRAADLAVFVHAMKRVIGFGEVVSVPVVENALFRRPFRTAPPMLPWGLLVVVLLWRCCGYLPHPMNPRVCPEAMMMFYVYTERDGRSIVF